MNSGAVRGAPRWKNLAVGLAVVLVLSALTLEFPPFGLRSVLVIALLGVPAWSWRQTATLPPHFL